MWEAGALGFKGFTCELHGADALFSGNLMEILDEIRRFDGFALFHCEDDSLLKKTEQRLRKQVVKTLWRFGVEVSRSRGVGGPDTALCGQKDRSSVAVAIRAFPPRSGAGFGPAQGSPSIPRRVRNTSV